MNWLARSIGSHVVRRRAIYRSTSLIIVRATSALNTVCPRTTETNCDKTTSVGVIHLFIKKWKNMRKTGFEHYLVSQLRVTAYQWMYTLRHITRRNKTVHTCLYKLGVLRRTSLFIGLHTDAIGWPISPNLLNPGLSVYIERIGNHNSFLQELEEKKNPGAYIIWHDIDHDSIETSLIHCRRQDLQQNSKKKEKNRKLKAKNRSNYKSFILRERNGTTAL